MVRTHLAALTLGVMLVASTTITSQAAAADSSTAPVPAESTANVGPQAPAANAKATLPPASERFAKDGTKEQPDFRKHVAPLLGRMGCNGRACHGSFQGQGGFRLSLFGYDFKADHEALAEGKEPRVDVKKPAESLALQKPTQTVDHEGGKLFEPGSWQYRLLLRWVQDGAPNVPANAPSLKQLAITPSEIQFKKVGEHTQLKVVAHWSDGTSEDVTPLCRFRTNNEAIAEIDETGKLTSVAAGDTDVVVFYDNGVVPIPVLLPISANLVEHYPAVPTPTKIDELVVAKLRKLGVVPSELSTDAEFLRRVSLDITGTLPTSTEVEAFLADQAPDKRAHKIDELLERPAYAAWWATRFCDLTGDNVQQINIQPGTPQEAAREWYAWFYQRIQANRPYDEIVAGLVLAKSRKSDQSYADYCREMGEHHEQAGKTALPDMSYADTLPVYWSRQNFRKPEEKALGFTYAFLGIRLECAQCHKHPFDAWTKQDFDQFTEFFNRVGYGISPAAKAEHKAMQEELGLGDKKGGDARKAIAELLKEGKVVPWQEVFISPVRRAPNKKQLLAALQAKKAKQAEIAKAKAEAAKNKLAKDDKTDAKKDDVKKDEAKPDEPKKDETKSKDAAKPTEAAKPKETAKPKPADKKALRKEMRKQPPVAPPVARLLGGPVVDLSKYDDPRTPLMDWLRRDPQKYFARALVNRVWANYFGRGIVDPTDDLSLANPPSNGPLLDYLTAEFVEHHFDLKWLHREIANSRTYQLSWRPNDSNRQDVRNFSHAAPRRLPAEVAYDAVVQATAGRGKENLEPADRSIGVASIGGGKKKNLGGNNYVLTVFGRPPRAANCDCERSSEPNLLQTIFLRNDQEMNNLLDRGDGWVKEVTRELAGEKAKAAAANGKGAKGGESEIARLERRLAQLVKKGDTDRAKNVKTRLEKLKAEEAAKAGSKTAEKAPPPKPSIDPAKLDAVLREAFVRTLGRPPAADELTRTRQHLEEAPNAGAGLHDLMWALVNTKEFIVNH